MTCNYVIVLVQCCVETQKLSKEFRASVSKPTINNELNDFPEPSQTDFNKSFDYANELCEILELPTVHGLLTQWFVNRRLINNRISLDCISLLSLTTPHASPLPPTASI